MDIQSTLNGLGAETLALQTMFAKLARNLSELSPAHAQAVRGMFDESSDFLEQFAVIAGKSASPEHTIKAIRIVEEIRSNVVGDPNQPRHGV